MSSQDKSSEAHAPADGSGAAASKRPLKITAAVVVALFVAIIAIAFVKERFSEPAALKPTDAQVLAAKTAAASALQAKGGDIASYRVTTGKKIRVLGKGVGSRRVLQVALLGESSRHFYLVDVASNEIVMQAEIDSIMKDDQFDDYGELVHLLGIR